MPPLLVLVAVLVTAHAAMPAHADEAAPPAPRANPELAAYADAMISTGAAFSGRGVWVTNVHQAVGVVVRLPDEGPELRFGALFDIFIARRARRDMVFGPSTDLASTVGLEAHAAWSRPSGWSLGPRASVAHGFGDAFEGIVGTVGVRARRGAWLLGADVVVPFEDPSDTSVLLGAGHTGRAPAVTLGLTLLGAWVLSGLGSLGS